MKDLLYYQNMAAVNAGYANLHEAEENLMNGGRVDYSTMTMILNNGSEMYANRVWDVACAAQMQEVYKAIDHTGNTNKHAIHHWTATPEFKLK